METARGVSYPTIHYWNMVKDMGYSQKLELVTMIVESLKEEEAARDEKECERGFRALAGCWAEDEGEDDIEAIIERGKNGRKGKREVADFDE